MIKFKTEKIIEVYDWDRLVIETYGRPYNFQQQDRCQERGTRRITIPEEGYDEEMHDSIPEVVNGSKMGVKFAVWLARDPKQKLDSKDNWDREHGISLWWQRNFYPDLQTLANDLYAKGLIEAGDYLINIDW